MLKTTIVVSSVLGTLLALVFMVPESKTDAIRRMIFSFCSGIVFGPFLNTMASANGEEVPYVHTGSVLAALISWWVMGAFVKVSQLIQSTEKIDIVSIIKIFKP